MSFQRKKTSVDAYSPQEVTEILIAMGCHKKKQHIDVLLIKAILAGVFLSFSGCMTLFVGGGSAGLGSSNPALRLVVQAFFYPAGLVFIVLTGAELVTSNMMVFTATCLQRKASLIDLAKSWVLSWIGNMIGSIFVGYILVYFTDVLSEEPYRAYCINFTDTHLTQLNFRVIFLRAIAANWLVCLAIFMSTSAKDIFSKIVALWIPVWIFVTLGFEHIVANMFLVQMGMYFGAPLSVGEYIWKGLVPVTLGNIVGGGFGVGGVFWYLYLYRHGEGASIGGVVVDKFMTEAADEEKIKMGDMLKCKCHHHHHYETGTALSDNADTMVILQGQSPVRSLTNIPTLTQKTAEDMV